MLIFSSVFYLTFWIKAGSNQRLSLTAICAAKAYKVVLHKLNHNDVLPARVKASTKWIPASIVKDK